jgi:hypothetical protein
MTVRVAAEQTFRLDKASMVSYVQDVLYHDPLYRRVSEGNNGAYFSAVVQPNVPLVLGTDMTVTLHEIEGETKVQVKIESQSFIIGDVFGMYYRYITAFFRKLDNAINLERHDTTTVKNVQFARPVGWVWKLLIALAAGLIMGLVIMPSLHASTLFSILLTACTVFLVWAMATALLQAIVDSKQSH